MSKATKSSVDDVESAVADKEKIIRSNLRELPEAYLKPAFLTMQASRKRLSAVNRSLHLLGGEGSESSKVRNRYGRVIRATEKEISAIRTALNQITKIRGLQEEIRQLNRKSNKFFNRRGTLMTHLQQAAITLPLWLPEDDKPLPPLCGGNAESPRKCAIGDRAAIHLSASSSTSGGAWILGEIMDIRKNSSDMYEVEDIDTENSGDRYLASRSNLIPLPKWRVNPTTNPEAIFPKGSIVLALFPQTTCFYKGLVETAPVTAQSNYIIRFEDSTYPEGFSPPMPVPQLYVLKYKDHCSVESAMPLSVYADDSS